MKERILKVLEEHCVAALDYDGNSMMKDGVIDSFTIMNLVSDLEEEFDIEIATEYVIAENFRNKKAIIALVENVLSNYNS